MFVLPFVIILIIRFIQIFGCSLHTDRYVFCLYSHNVAAKGKFIAFVSTDAETENPQTELKAGIDLLCPVDEIFFYLYDRYKSLNVPSWGNCFISTVSQLIIYFRLGGF